MLACALVIIADKSLETGINLQTGKLREGCQLLDEPGARSGEEVDPWWIKTVWALHGLKVVQLCISKGGAYREWLEESRGSLELLTLARV